MSNKEMVENWINSLRSGKYAQGLGQLFNPSSNKYCCLGVFAVCNNIPLQRDGLRVEGDELKYTKSSTEMYPTIDAILGEDEVQNLWQFSDRDGWTFGQIADYAEKNILPKM